MISITNAVHLAVQHAIQAAAQQAELTLDHLDTDQIVPSLPPSDDLGDLAFPMFPLARTFRTAPATIAQNVADILSQTDEIWVASAEAAGPYLNIRLRRTPYAETIAESLITEPDRFGESSRYAGSRVMVEFSCPNTNKPLHLGHLRNNALGSSVARLFQAAGAEIQRVNLINDRGIHICKSMLAYEKFGGGETPESAGKKSDHFVGDYYVAFDKWAKEDENAEKEARSMLKAW